ncbi:DUF885 domain-containing protein [Stieleria sp. JC731]|uniref:DUF885 family protein n=1 Tax=Pirellulaceae TaxID=2691357 RepID=UPI001E6425CA|nr:DUF885 family protein [Stieleria sp. JC731]MCC9600267.1 DUF885 domain-containing protein [Stieleria sp. JC731]
MILNCFNRSFLLSALTALSLVSLPPTDVNAEEIRTWIIRYDSDKDTLRRRYRLPLDTKARTLTEQTTKDWLKRLEEVDFDKLDRVGQTDFLLFRSELEYQLANNQLQWKRDDAAAELIPYWESLLKFCADREEVTPIDAMTVAGNLDRIASEAENAAKQIEKTDLADTSDEAVQKRLDGLRAAELISQFENCVSEAHRFYDGYDPSYSWWAEQPVKRLRAALSAHRTAIREKLVGVPESDQETIIGLPIGAEGLELELQHEWIAHTPAELIELANREMEWCDQQMAIASEELGFGDDWRAALAHTKSKHVQPGDQPKMIRDLAWEAIRFLDSHDLVTVPPLAANGWRVTMMSPERQRVNPYFLGGPMIIVSFPTNEMTHDEKLMSMRSNNKHFARATVHHELIPGHHLQHYMLPRYKAYRSMFRTPFWIEGWALYWEMLLWDLDFAQSAEDRVGMLFWRKHRCARIIFSLSYHLGTMTPGQCVDYLVDRVGHERSAATAEVRRSIMGGYSPLYQAAYMLGGLQLRKLHETLVVGGKMTNRQFHDAVLKEHCIPMEVLRNYMTDQPLTPDTRPTWRFADE